VAFSSEFFFLEDLDSFVSEDRGVKNDMQCVKAKEIIELKPRSLID
jgi:hypothetical protein